MSTYLKVLKLGRIAMAARGSRLQRFFSVSALRWQNLKDEILKKPLPEAEQKPMTHTVQNLSPLQLNLLELVTAEIIEERRVQLQLEPPYMIDDFVGTFIGSKVELAKETDGERINIFFNVSKSVPRRNDEAGDLSLVRSVPKFEVLIKRNDFILSIFCVFKPSAFDDLIESDAEDNSVDENNDVFKIQDLSLYNHGWNESCFTVDASLIDDDLQDLLLDSLEERGITQEFGRKLSDFATAREHALYIEFLENLSKFTVGLPPPLTEAKD